MRRRSADYVDVRVACPYCEFKMSIEASSILGERHVLLCIDCRETFVVEISVDVTFKIRALAGVTSDAVLDRLAIGNPGKEDSDGRADPDSLATESGAPVLEQIEGELESTIGERPDDSEPGIPVLTDVVIGETELVVDDDPDPAEAGAVKLIDREGLALEQIRQGEMVSRVNGKGRDLTPAEISELRTLLGEKLAEEDSQASPELELELEGTPFKPCAECKTRTFCRNRSLCSRANPAPVHSGNNSRKTSISSVAKPAPKSLANDGLKYGDRR